MTITNAVAQTEDTLVCNKDVQTEALSSSIMTNRTVHEKETQTIGIKCRNKEFQVDLQPKNVFMDNDPRIVRL